MNRPCRKKSFCCRHLVLALLLMGLCGWSGCSGARHGTSIQSHRVGQLFSHQEAVGLQSDDQSRPWLLKWALTEDTWNGGELFLTVHQRPTSRSATSDPEFTAAIYFKVGDRLKLMRRLNSMAFGSSFFQKPVVVWVPVNGTERRQLIQITEIQSGTGRYTREHVFETIVMPVRVSRRAPGLDLKEVEFIPAAESFQAHLAKGEGVWKGVTSRFTTDGLFFDFYIWNDGDANCCPTAGTVNGTYKVERQPDGRLRISMDTFKRAPINLASE
jgi:hypothetical protein